MNKSPSTVIIHLHKDGIHLSDYVVQTFVISLLEEVNKGNKPDKEIKVSNYLVWEAFRASLYKDYAHLKNLFKWKINDEEVTMNNDMQFEYKMKKDIYGDYSIVDYNIYLLEKLLEPSS